MPAIILVVEGEGDEDALPSLIKRLLIEADHTEWQVRSRRTKVVGNVGALRKRLDDHVEYLREESPGAALFVFDLDDECPKTVGLEIAERVRRAGLPFPAAIVFAHCEFEAWLLASVETVSAGNARFSEPTTYDGDPDTLRGAAEWIQARTVPKYKKRTDQRAFASKIDPATARSRSRSFRRLCHALDELVASEPGTVTPAPPPR